jgi:hypothetical protein
MSDNHVWLEVPLHKNQLGKFKIEEHQDIMDKITLSFDGSIMSVDRSVVEPFYKKNQVDMFRAGYTKTQSLKIKIDSPDAFWDLVSYYVEI